MVGFLLRGELKKEKKIAAEILMRPKLSRLDSIFFKSSWIPASAGMTTKNHAFLMFVSPAKAGVQFEAFKKKAPPTNDV